MYQKLWVSLTICVAIVGCSPEKVTVSIANQDALEKEIINGAKCSPEEQESAVELFVNMVVDYPGFGESQVSSYLCGGTLIAPDVVLTAAHCLDISEFTYGIGEIKSVEYYVTWEEDLTYLKGAQGMVTPKNSVAATSFFFEEEYDGHRMEGPGVGNFHDVGLVFLAKPLKIKPAVVISREEAKQIVVGAPVTIAGWGMRSPNEEESDLSGQKYCARSTINEVGKHEIQIGSDEKSARKCFGDSGGPTYMEVFTPDGLQSRVIGITSHAYDDAICYKGGLDTRVDAWLDWIDSKMQEGCRNLKRSWCDVAGIVPASYVYEKGEEKPAQKTNGWLDYILSFFYPEYYSR